MGRAQRRLVCVAPGVAAAITKALSHCTEAEAAAQIMIVLDADEETCRTGYCEAASLETLMASAMSLAIGDSVQQSGGWVKHVI